MPDVVAGGIGGGSGSVCQRAGFGGEWRAAFGGRDAASGGRGAASAVALLDGGVASAASITKT